MANIMDTGRYSRQTAVPNLGESGQDRLASSRVAVVGAGGVKSPLLFYLAAAGVGHIRIVDFDVVELSNLNRQILYDVLDIGKRKVDAAANRLRGLNPDIHIEPVFDRVGPHNFVDLLSGFDLVFEGGDGAQARKDFNQCAFEFRMTYVHASAQYNYAYVTTVEPGRSACFECFFEDLPQSHGGPVPIIGSAAGIAGSVAASEAISILSGNGPTLSGRAFFYDGWAGYSCQVPQVRRADCAVCGTAVDRVTLDESC